MACDTFIKIANKCKRHFVALQPGETEPFIEEIVRTMPKITEDLSPQQVHTFYEACGYMISAQGQKSTQERLIQELMGIPNAAVRTDVFIAKASADDGNSGTRLSPMLRETTPRCRTLKPSVSSATS